MEKTPGKYHRIVVKFGTSLLTSGTDRIDESVMSGLVAQASKLIGEGHEIIIVSSGAIAAGRQKLGLSKKLREIPYKQVLASVGQHYLMGYYERLFGQHGITVAQALLTRANLLERAGYLNARNTLMALMELGVVCIVNENDVVAVEEIEEARYGDNDNLSAMVANLIDADLLAILSDIGGLYTADPHCHPDARLITEVEHIDASIEALAAGTAGKLGTGGMATKIEAAKLATSSGVNVVIAAGQEPVVLLRLAGGETIGTHFIPVTTKLESRERWMLSGLATHGRLTVDSGAVKALRVQKRSLLAAGITGVSGTFDRGDIVEIQDPRGNQVGCGIANYSSKELALIKGAHSGEIPAAIGYEYGAAVVHRNNLVITE